MGGLQGTEQNGQQSRLTAHDTYFLMLAAILLLLTGMLTPPAANTAGVLSDALKLVVGLCSKV